MAKEKKYIIDGMEFTFNHDLTLRELKEISAKIEPERFFEIILVPARSCKFDGDKILNMKESQAEKIITDFWEERKKKTEASLQNYMNSMLPSED